MTDMIERVARALYNREARGHGDWSVDCPPGSTFERYWLDSARAAIEAMREPTEAMYRAAETAIDPLSSESAVGQYWPAMIDAALAERDAK